MRRTRTVDLLLIGAVIAMFAVPLALRVGAAYGGSDAAATELVERSGYEPWFSPVLRPSSKEIESGLFALQAALGAGVLGFALGRLSARRPARPEPEH